MPKPRRKPTPKRSAAKPNAPARLRRLWLSAAVGTVAVVALGVAAVVTSTPQQPESRPVVTRPVVAPRPTPPKANADTTTPKSLAELLALTPEQLAKVDVAVVNLLCAEGLPGSEGIDVPAALAKLDAWAMAVQFNTERHLYRVTDPRYADHYHHSETYLRAEFLLQTLQEDCGVRYNPDAIYDPDLSDSHDSFIHGVIDPKHGGTCASMPVLYAAVGRRLGYPIKLVMTRGHVFCRWDDGKGERFNIEGTNGFSSYPDEFYRKWPYGVTAEELTSREYLVSLTPTEEVAMFMAARGHCFMDTHRFTEALEAYKVMARLAPTFKVHGQFVAGAQLAAEKGLAEYERVYGKMPERMDPPPPPPEFAGTSGGP